MEVQVAHHVVPVTLLELEQVDVVVPVGRAEVQIADPVTKDEVTAAARHRLEYETHLEIVGHTAAPTDVRGACLPRRGVTCRPQAGGSCIRSTVACICGVDEWCHMVTACSV